MEKFNFKSMMDLKWTDIRKAAKSGNVVLLPIGVVEEHGPQLCLGTDIYSANIHCRFVQAKLKENDLEAIIAPPFYWGICQATRNFIGSFAIRKETAKALLFDIISSLKDFGFTEIYGINGHGDIEQNIFIIETFREATEKLDIKVRYLFYEEVMHHYGISGEEPYICPLEKPTEIFNTTTVPDVHAGDIETAVINEFYPGCADTAVAEKLPPVQLPDEKVMEWIFGGKTKELSADGYLGDPGQYRSVDVQGHIENIADRIVKSIILKREKK